MLGGVQLWARRQLSGCGVQQALQTTKPDVVALLLTSEAYKVCNAEPPGRLPRPRERVERRETDSEPDEPQDQHGQGDWAGWDRRMY